MSDLTLIQNADWVIAWDESAKSHGYLRNADVAFKGDTIIHVGKSYGEKPDRVIDGRELMIMPGLVDIHSHPSLEPSWRGIREEHGVPEMYMTGLYERAVAYARDEEGERASMEVVTPNCCSPALPRLRIFPRHIPAGLTWSPKAAFASL